MANTAEYVESLEKGVIVNTKEFGLMRYHNKLNRKGDMVFIGRGKGKIESIIFVTVNRDKISGDEKILSFNQPYEIEKRFNHPSDDLNFYRLMDGELKRWGIKND